jgi:hypothetical protein
MAADFPVSGNVRGYNGYAQGKSLGNRKPKALDA